MGARAVKFIDPKTKTAGVWECAYRKTKPKGTEVDGVDVIAILTKNQRKDKYFIFVKQYRIPIRGWSLEFPAGESLTSVLVIERPFFSVHWFKIFLLSYRKSYQMKEHC